MKFILASASPRRKELLAQILPEFDVIVPDADENITHSEPAEMATDRAAAKAEAVARTFTVGDELLPEDLVVIGADTVVSHNGVILGKPRDKAEAFQMLDDLSDDTHEVYTGVCILYVKRDGRMMRDTFCERTLVTFYPITKLEIADYVASGDPMDKAGAYGIQTGAGKYIRGIDGDYDNVVGLPVPHLYQELKTLRVIKE